MFPFSFDRSSCLRPRARHASLLRLSSALPVLLAVVAASTAQSASAQIMNFTSRNGQNLAACGAAVGGPFQQSAFPSAIETHDALAVADPGNAQMSASFANSFLGAVPAPFGISMRNSGSVMRGPLIGFASGATADARDEWEFTISVPMRFTFSASISATNSAGPMSPVTYMFAGLGGGAQFILDPGVPPSALSGVLFSPGTLASAATGTIMPGLYFVSLNGRTEGVNVWPHTGTFDGALDLALDCGVMNSYCTSGVTTNGCTATIQGTGTPSASAGSGFTLDVVGMEGASQGLILYGVSGRTGVPWGTSSSFLCVKSPRQRTSAQSGGGTAGACDGAISLDWNAFVASNPSALGVPFTAGELVQAQGWFRDPPSPKATMLSNAVEFAVCP